MYTRSNVFSYKPYARLGKGPIAVGTRNYSRRRLLSALFALRECSWLAVSSRILLRGWLCVGSWKTRLLVLASDSPTSKSHTCAHMYHRIANIEHRTCGDGIQIQRTRNNMYHGRGRQTYIPVLETRSIIPYFLPSFWWWLLKQPVVTQTQRKGVSVPKPELRAPLPSRVYLAPCSAFGEKISLVAEEKNPLAR